jgi:hypothetical protein
LKGESWEDISKDVITLRENLLATDDIMLLGLPKGIATYKKKGAKANLPGHIAAAMHYGQSRERFGDQAAPPIVAGDQVKLFYLDTAWGKSASMALPVDIKVIPEWFTEHYNIDREKHLKRLIDNPLNNILKAINKSVPLPETQNIFL